LVLGRAAWKLIEPEESASWSEFRQAVEAEFGIPEEYRGRSILNIAKQPKESDVDFVKRAERTRKRLRVDK
jgi:hypothetical protein